MILPTFLLVLAPLAPAAAPEAPAAEVAFFEKQIRPILAARCYSCHGAKGTARGGLRLDNVAGIRKGGDSGTIFHAANPEQGLLIRSVRYAGDLKMPPRSKLPPAEIALLETWIKRGAHLPSEKVEAAVVPIPSKGPLRSMHWAFQPLRDPPVPDLPPTHNLRNPIDRFLQAKLLARGLPIAPPADRRTLLRRVTFDLTGLPPTPDEMRAFLADSSPLAYERVVDRLLASPAYGERWGRHWLDVARYADSNGMDENLVQSHAWRYRDYVLNAFNHDLPYDRFVREQLAGDLLPDPTPEQLIATGFLALGPKMLAEDDPVKMQMDIVDEQIDTLGKTFLGLTLGCARCHDHKYDPIPTSDYYALAGIFKSTRVMDTYTVVARWFERPVGSRDQVQQLLAQRRVIEATRKTLTERTRQAEDRVRADLRAQANRYLEAARELNRRRAALPTLTALMNDKQPPQGAMVVEAENFTRGNVKKEFTGYGEKIGVIYNAGPLPNLAEYELSVDNPGIYQLELRYTAADSRPIQIILNGATLTDSAVQSVTGSWYPDKQRWSPEALCSLVAGKNTLKFRREGPFPHIDKFALIPRDLPPGTVPAPPISPEQFARDRKLDPRFLQRWSAHLLKSPTATPEQLAQAASDPKGPFALPRPADALFPADTLAELRKLRDTVKRQEDALPQLPEAMGATDGSITNVRVHLRGNHLTLGEEVPRRFPRILAGENQVPLDTRQSGRLELAHWLTRPDHPLTARVLVNRVWHWHFGLGLVRSTDNFGILGDTPTHPELLDWLALRFVEDGWSIKALHRRILLSAAYQRSADWNPVASERDPDNRFHGRWHRQRLNAESLRDALLAVSGSLDRAMGGSLLEGKNRGYVPGYPNGIYERYDYARRSVYLPVIRSMLYEVFQAFDFPDPSTPNGERATTTIAPQALFSLNGKLMTEQSRAFALSLLDSPGNDLQRIDHAYQRALGRSPTSAESDRAVAFLHRLDAAWTTHNLPVEERRRRSWQGLCRVLLSSNEFVYVD